MTKVLLTCVAFFVVLPLVIIRIDFLTLQWYSNIRFYYFFSFLSSRNIIPYLSGWNFNMVNQIFQELKTMECAKI